MTSVLYCARSLLRPDRQAQLFNALLEQFEDLSAGAEVLEDCCSPACSEIADHIRERRRHYRSFFGASGFESILERPQRGFKGGLVPPRYPSLDTQEVVERRRIFGRRWTMPERDVGAELLYVEGQVQIRLRRDSHAQRWVET